MFRTIPPQLSQHTRAIIPSPVWTLLKDAYQEQASPTSFLNAIGGGGCIKYKRSFAGERGQTAGQFLWVMIMATHPSGRRGEIRWKSCSEHMHAERPHLARVDMLPLGRRSTPSAHLFFSGHTHDEVLTVTRTLLASPLPAPPRSFSPHAPVSSAGRETFWGCLLNVMQKKVVLSHVLDWKTKMIVLEK